MSWIILALSLGAAITSIIHGVFMLFGSLSVSGAEIFGIPSTLLASLPIISAVLALIGGIIAFNRSKWGALFLFIAMGLCVPSRDTWLYGGVYFFAGLFCFFLKSESQDSYYDYDDYDNEQGEPDFYYDPAIPEPSQEELEREPFSTGFQQDILEGDISADEALQFNAEPPRVRRRMSKSCPECGAVVSRLSRICPTCGAKLSVMPEDEEIEEEEREGERVELNLNLN
ncbi:MAG: zinc ribbon domain-containing protein, partial [Synergistaceae bacterium]|nr:zinc ribbon domain-containing protein [Synergistaceae bacterium]